MNFKLIGLFVVILISFSATFYNCSKEPPGATPRFVYVAEQAAAEVVNMLGGQGELVIFGFDQKHKTQHEQILGFTRVVEKGGLSVKERVIAEPPLDENGDIAEGSVSTAQFEALLDKDCAAVISFAGTPPRSVLRSFKGKETKIVVIGGGQEPIPPMVQNGLIDLAVTHRRGEYNGPPIDTIEKWYAAYYQVLKASE